MFVQTSVANQVNLINVGGATLNFWDGAAGPKFNGAVNGGDGIWQNGSGNDNWTDATGTVNAAYDDGAFAIFTGAAGTVTIDNGLGAVTASGLQFAADGYTITGDALALTGPQSVIRVGDGTAAGAGYTATIDARAHRRHPAGQDRPRHARADRRQQLHRRHRDQRRHAADLGRRQSRRRGGRSQPQRRHAQHHGEPELRARGRRSPAPAPSSPMRGPR